MSLQSHREYRCQLFLAPTDIECADWRGQHLSGCLVAAAAVVAAAAAAAGVDPAGKFQGVVAVGRQQLVAAASDCGSCLGRWSA